MKGDKDDSVAQHVWNDLHTISLYISFKIFFMLGNWKVFLLILLTSRAANSSAISSESG